MTSLVKHVTEILEVVKFNAKSPQKLAIVFDIDSTLITYETDVCIIPVINIFKLAKRLGYNIFIITARLEKYRDTTHADLRKCKVDVPDVKLYMMPPGTRSVRNFKLNCRKNIYERGFNVIMSIGDQPHDTGAYGGISIELPPED